MKKPATKAPAVKQFRLTKEKRLMLIGLQTVGQSLIRRLDDVVASAEEITGEIEESGHTSDFIWDAGIAKDVDDLAQLVNATNKRRAK